MLLETYQVIVLIFSTHKVICKLNKDVSKLFQVLITLIQVYENGNNLELKNIKCDKSKVLSDVHKCIWLKH